MNVIWKHPFTCVIAGPTGCGKTMWVREFLKFKSMMMEPVPYEVVWCYGEWQAAYEEMKDVTFVEGLPQPQTWSDGKPRPSFGHYYGFLALKASCLVVLLRDKLKNF